VFIAISVDGYIARLDGSIDWLERVQLQGEEHCYQLFFAGDGPEQRLTLTGTRSWPTGLTQLRYQVG
jgi:hypothetical protein